MSLQPVGLALQKGPANERYHIARFRLRQVSGRRDLSMVLSGAKDFAPESRLAGLIRLHGRDSLAGVV
jgi:hypothetical protein